MTLEGARLLELHSSVSVASGMSHKRFISYVYIVHQVASMSKRRTCSLINRVTYKNLTNNRMSANTTQ